MAGTLNGIDVLFSPLERNRFFYGKLLDVRNLHVEQSYGIRSRWFLNRFVTGSGVVAGLDLAPDPADTARVVLAPGFAIDAYGRELVVDEPLVIDATALTDDQGQPTGSAPAGTTVTLALAYRESKTHPVPVLVADCDASGDCAPDLVREGVRVLVREASGPAGDPPSCTFPGGLPADAAALHAALAASTAAKTTALGVDASVTLGRYTPSTATLDPTAGRRLVYGNESLFELIACLADRVGALSGALLLLYLQGDGQSGGAGQALAQPLVARAVDGSGSPATGQLVQFAVTSGGGSVTPAIESSPGTYESQWTLGAAGVQEARASMPGSSLTVTFHATLV